MHPKIAHSTLIHHAPYTDENGVTYDVPYRPVLYFNMNKIMVTETISLSLIDKEVIPQVSDKTLVDLDDDS